MGSSKTTSSGTTERRQKKGTAQPINSTSRKPHNSKPRGPNRNDSVIKPDDRPGTPRPDEVIRPSRKGFVAGDEEEVDKEDVHWEESTDVHAKRKEERDKERKVKKEAERRKSLNKSIERPKRGGGSRSEVENSDVGDSDVGDSDVDFGKHGVVSEGRVYEGVDRRPRVGSSAGFDEAVGSSAHREESPSLFMGPGMSGNLASKELGKREPAIKAEEEEEEDAEGSRPKKLESRNRRSADAEKPKNDLRSKRRKTKPFMGRV